MSQPQRNDEDSSLLLVLKGVLIGIANVIPGVSGGTFALILGIYDRLLFALKAIGPKTIKITLQLVVGPHRVDRREAFLEEMRRIDLWFLIRLGIGLVIAVFSSSFAINWLLVNQPALTLAFFIGLIVPSIAVPWRMMEKRTPAVLLWAIPGIAVTVGVAVAFSADVEGSRNPIIVFFAGVLVICAMILPGISGSFVLLVIGQYRNAIEAIQNFQLGLAAGKLDTDALILLVTLASGCVIGLLLFARFLVWILARYRSVTLAFLIGLVLGSFWVMWPFKDFEQGASVAGSKGEAKTDVRIATAPNRLPVSAGEFGGCSAAFVAGIIGALAVERLGKSKNQPSKEPAKG